MNVYRLILFFLLNVFVTVNAQQLVGDCLEPLPCFERKLSIVAHIIKERGSDGTLEQENEAKIQTAIAIVNQYFDPICISFEICEFKYVDNFQFDRERPQDFFNEHHVEHRINIYYSNIGLSAISNLDIEEISQGGIKNVNYRSPLTTDVDAQIHLQKSISDNGLFLTYAMARFFDLYNTFETKFGRELADESNCETTGDLVCDTPADPHVLANDFIESNCFMVSQIPDDNTDIYTPMTGNLMSLFNCACGFTCGQYRRMAEAFESRTVKVW